MRAIRSPRLRSCSVRGPALAAAVTALLTGMTAGLWPPGAGDASVIAAAGPAGSWGRAIEVPGLAALNTGGGAWVTSVSCGSAGNCAAGGYYVGSGKFQGFVAVERNGRWGKAIEVPGLGALNRGGFAKVDSVSCASAGSCAAGGYYIGPGKAQGFVAVEKNGRWGKAIEVPGLAALNTRGQAGVGSVSCVSAGSCAAGGDYWDRHGQQGFVAVERHGRWGKAIEVPGLAALNKGEYAVVWSVSCASAGNCAAGGYYTDRSHHRHGFVAAERNGRWGRAIEVPGLGALNAGGFAWVGSVSCASAGSCAAGGRYGGGGHRHGFVAVERNGVWARAIEVPGLAALNTGRAAKVTSVSCASAGNCAAGGYYTDRSHHRQGFVAVEKDGRWGRAIEVPGLGALNAGGLAWVGSVSCASAGNCAAAGDYFMRDDKRQGFVAVEKNGRWGTAIEVPGLGALNTGGDAALNSVSCAPAGTCAAGGSYTDAPDNFQGFVVSQTG